MLKYTIEIQKLSGRKEELNLELTNITKLIESKKDVKVPKGLEKDIEEL